MRELHVVALSDDGRHVVLATRAGTASGEFRVALDERLVAAVRGELPAPGRDAPPSISPRDIQARLRNGEAPEEIAASAGVPLSRVERYAGPVLAELDRMITGARSGVVARPRLGPSALPLGEAVEAHLAEVAHLAEASVRWSARRTELGRWVVSVSWTARGRRRTAGWHYDPATREVVAVDGPSAVLGHVEAEAAAAPAARRTAPPASAGGRAAARGAPAPAARSSQTAPDSPGRAVRRTTPTSAGARATPPRTATTTPATAPTARGRSATASPTPAVPARPAAAKAARPAAVKGPGPAAAKAARPAAPSSARPAAAPAARPAAPVRAATSSGPAAPRRAASRRSAVPPLDEVSAQAAVGRPQTARPPAAPAPAAPPPAAPSPAAPSPAAPSPAGPGDPSLPGPPVLRVVPPSASAQDGDDAVGPREPAPARRTAGRRAGGRDWADVLMGAAPAAPAAEPRQD